MLRTAGIMVFATVLIVPASSQLVMMLAVVSGATEHDMMGFIGFVLGAFIVKYYVFVACAAFVFLATKRLFNAFDYRSADLAIGTLFALLVFIPPLAPPAWLWFSILATGFGRQVGSLLWQAIGIIYLVASVLIAGVTLVAFGIIEVPYFNEFLAFSGLVLLVGWLCHGICLILGAREMAGSGPAVSR